MILYIFANLTKAVMKKDKDAIEKMIAYLEENNLNYILLCSCFLYMFRLFDYPKTKKL